MGKSAPSPPPAPDPVAVANAQSAANIQTADATQKLNMSNVSGPYGSTTYSADSSAPSGYAQTTALSPAEQSLFNQYTGLQGGALSTAGQALSGASNALNTSLSPPSLQTSYQGGGQQAINDAVNSTFNQQKGLLDPIWNLNTEQQQAKLAADGLDANSTAYQNDMGIFNTSKNQAYTQAANNAVQAGQAEQNTLFNQAGAQAGFGNAANQQNFQNIAYAANQPIDQFSALLGQGQVQGPQSIATPNTQVAPTDVVGANALAAQYNQANYQSQLQNRASGLGGLFNLGSSLIGTFL